MVVGVIVTAIVARYFGPERYGIFNYALSLVTLFTAFSTLGMDTLTVKGILDRKYEEGTILCTSMILRVVGGVLLVVFSLITIRILEPGDSLLFVLVGILSVSMVFKAFEVIEYWIQAYQRAKISSIVRMISYVITSALKILLVVLGGTLVHYSVIHTLGVVLVGAGLLSAYFVKRDESSAWRWDFAYAKSILSQSWYLIVSGLMVTLYMQIDKIMLGTLLPSKTGVGIYSAATSIAQMWYFVPLAIITSYKPVIMNKKNLGDEKEYLGSVQNLYSIVAWTGIIFGVLILIFSKLIVSLLYGPEYAEAANILSVSIWAGTFAMLGSARGETWLICEGLQRYSMIYVGFGAIVNIILNYLFIPLYGGIGAAIATLISQISVSLIAPFFFKPTRISSKMMLKAFLIRKLP
jgi:O-antigen/teichoic acid export membrane protein